MIVFRIGPSEVRSVILWYPIVRPLMKVSQNMNPIFRNVWFRTSLPTSQHNDFIMTHMNHVVLNMGQKVDFSLCG